MRNNERRVNVGFLVSFIALVATCFNWAADTPKASVIFTSRAGWTIKYPRNWQVTSCNNCPDPTDPNVFVSFFDPSTNGIVMIQHLSDKPVDRSIEKWLNEIKKITVANPRIDERWITLDGRRALNVKTRNPDSSESENLYVVYGAKTFMIQASPIEDNDFYRAFKRMLSSLRFAKR